MLAWMEVPMLGVIGSGGVLGLLRTAVRGYTVVIIERERRIGTLAAIEQLPPGGELVERDREGSYRRIRKSIAPIAPIPQLPTGDSGALE